MRRAFALPGTVAPADLVDVASGASGGRGYVGWQVFVQTVEREVDWLTGEQRLGQLGGGRFWVFGSTHQREEGWPVEGLAAFELEGFGFTEAGAVTGPEGEAAVIEPTAAGASKHLEEFVGADFALGVFGGVATVGDQHRAEREVDTRSQSGRRDDYAQLAGLGPRLDEFRTLVVGQAAVVEAHALAEEAIEVVAGHGALAG